MDQIADIASTGPVPGFKVITDTGRFLQQDQAAASEIPDLVYMLPSPGPDRADIEVEVASADKTITNTESEPQNENILVQDVVPELRPILPDQIGVRIVTKPTAQKKLKEDIKATKDVRHGVNARPVFISRTNSRKLRRATRDGKVKDIIKEGIAKVEHSNIKELVITAQNENQSTNMTDMGK